MLFSKSQLRLIYCLLLGAVYSLALPAGAESVLSSSGGEQKLLLAQAGCASCGAQLDPALLVEASSGKKANTSVLTDSLWGNLILELAYERDPELSKLARRGKLLNFGTTSAVMGIAAGTLAQGITALRVINPPPGKPDSYAPLNVGVALSGATILVMSGRIYIGHRLAKAIQQKQIRLRDNVQSILAHMESSQGSCAVARNQLQELIGARACNEWVQLWQSSHKLALLPNKSISVDTSIKDQMVEAALTRTAGGLQ